MDCASRRAQLSAGSIQIAPDLLFTAGKQAADTAVGDKDKRLRFLLLCDRSQSSDELADWGLDAAHELGDEYVS